MCNKRRKQHSLEDCSVAITDRTDLWSTLFRWPQVARYTYIQSLITIDWGIRLILKSITSTIWEGVVLVLLISGSHNEHHWEGLRWQDIYIPIFVKIVIGDQAILRLHLRNLIDYNVGITDGRDLWCTPLKCLHVAWYSYQVSWRLVHAFEQY
jgi:hypothetical protein